MLVKMLEKAFCKTILAIGIMVMAGTAPARASEEENAPAREWTAEGEDGASSAELPPGEASEGGLCGPDCGVPG